MYLSNTEMKLSGCCLARSCKDATNLFYLIVIHFKTLPVAQIIDDKASNDRAINEQRTGKDTEEIESCLI